MRFLGGRKAVDGLGVSRFPGYDLLDHPFMIFRTALEGGNGAVRWVALEVWGIFSSSLSWSLNQSSYAWWLMMKSKFVVLPRGANAAPEVRAVGRVSDRTGRSDPSRISLTN